MTRRPGPGGSRCRRVAAALAATSLFVLPQALMIGPAAADTLTPAPSSTTSSPAPAGTLLLDRMTTVLRQGQDLAIRGRLRLTGVSAEVAAHSSVALFADRALGSRTALHEARDATDGRVSGNQVGNPVPVAASGVFALTVPADEAPWHAAGVYPLTLVATAPLPSGDSRVATLTTFLPYFPDPVPQRAAFTLVVPVTDQPAVVAPNVLVDSRIAQEVAHGGRLDRLLGFADSPTERSTAGALTLAVDPSLMDTLRTMSVGPWRDLTAKKTRPANDEANRALSRLSELSTEATTMLLPYGDVDVTGLAAAGRPDHISTAVRLSPQHLSNDISAAGTTSNIALPAGGCTSPDGFAALAAVGVTSAIVDDTCLPADPALTYTPSAHTRVLLGGRPVNLLVTDGELDRMIAAGPGGSPAASTPRAAEQLFLAETAMIVLEQPNLPRTIVAATPRNWNPPSGWLPTLLRDASTVPWLSASSAPDLLSSAEVARGSLLPVDNAALPVSYLDEVADGQGLLAGICTMLPARPESLRADCEQAWTFLGAESANFRNDVPAGRRLLNALVGRAGAYGSAVHVAASPEVTLTSRSGRVPVVLENELAQPVTVQLTLQARDRSRLRSATVVTRTLRARQKVQVEIKVHAESAGRFPVLLTLHSPSGQQLGEPLQITVRSTAYGILALAITAGAVGVLFLAVLIRAVRRLLALRHRRRVAAHGAGTVG
jgi:hypothetical protein